MKKKRTKMISWKRVVSLLLTAAMILTAAPQTGTTALAAENSDTSVDTQVLSADDTLADAESNENDADDDTTQPEDGQDETQLPEESGDGSENGGDVLPEDPDQEGNPDDAEEPEEVTEPADEQEGDGEDAEGIVSEEETVSENTLAAELMENESPKDGEESDYNGEPMTKQDDGDGWEYNRLVISAFEGGGLSDARIVDILRSYQESGQQFECVQLDMKDTGSKKIKKDILDAAIAVLRTDHKYKDKNDNGDGEGKPKFWIDYNFQNQKLGEENESEEYRNYGFTILQPKADTINTDLDANVKVTPVAGQGVKLKFPAVNFNAEQVVVNFEGVANSGMIKESLARAEDVRYYLFTVKSGQFEAHDEEGCDNGGYDNESNGRKFQVDDVRRLKANTEYLMAPVEDVDSMSAGDTRALLPPFDGAANVTYKSYTPDVISISKEDGKPVLSAWEPGEALYGVTYKADGVSSAEFFRMQVESALYKIDFLEKEIKMEVGENNYLDVVCYPSDIDKNSIGLEWKKTPDNSEVIALDNGNITALKPGTVTVTATCKKDDANTLTATCTITVEGILDWDEVRGDVDSMNLYAVSGCDTTLDDVKFPDELQDEWKWENPELPLAPYAGLEGHDFVAICKKDGVEGKFPIYVRMINVTGITMQSREPESASSDDGRENGQKNSSEDEWGDWNPWEIPTTMEKGDRLSLGFWYNLANIEGPDWDPDNEETKAVKAKLAEKYEVVWDSSPKELGEKQEDGTYEYTASILKKPEKAEKKTFTVSLKDRKTNKVVWKASHTLTVTTGNLFDWEPIRESYKWENLKDEYDQQDKLTSLTLTVKMEKTEYEKWKLTYTSLDNTILQLKAPTVTSGSSKDENGQDIETTIVKIPCIQKSTGRVWIQITAQDEIKSSERFAVNLEDPAPTLLSAATQTINKASTELSVPIVVSASAYFPLVKKTGGTPDVSIAEVKIGSKVVEDVFELTDIKESSIASGSEPYNGVYSMKLGLKGNPSGVKTGNYAVKLGLKTENNAYTISLTVKVTDVKPKVTFKQTKKLNLFYTDNEGAGTLQINTGEKIKSVQLIDYVDNKPSKNASCHYEVKYDNDVYQIVRKSGLTAESFNEKLTKGTLEYTVEGYTETFRTTFTVATENKAPAIVLSAKSDTLYPGVGYYDSWISMTDKATGKSFVPSEAIWYTGKNQNRKEEELKIGEFKETEEPNWKDITDTASKNTYGLFVTDNGNIVSRLREAESYGQKADTMNLELKKANWRNPVAVSYKLQVNTAAPKLTLGKATLTLNKNADVYRGQQERTALRLKGFNDLIGNNVNWVSITGQDDKSKAELKGKDSSLVIMYWDDCGDVVVRFNDNDIVPGTYKYKISVGEHGEREYASTVLTVKIVDKAVKQSLKVTAKGSIDVLNREGTFIAYTPKISNLTGTVVDGELAGKDADLFDSSFDPDNGKLIVKAVEGRIYSTKITYEVHTVFRVQTEDWRTYKISSDNDAKAKPFKIKVKQGKPKLTVTAVGGNTLYRQRDNSVDIRIEAILGKQDVEIEDVWQKNYESDLKLEKTTIEVVEEGEDGEDVDASEIFRMAKNYQEVTYNPQTKSVRVKLSSSWYPEEIRKNGTYKLKLAVRFRGKAGDVKETEVTCPIVVR